MTERTSMHATDFRTPARGRVLAASAIVVASLAACSVSPAADGAATSPTDAAQATFVDPTGSPEALDLSPWPVEEFWLQVAPGGLTLNSYGSLEAMAQDADLIVLGRAIDVVDGRPIPPEAGADDMALGVVRFVVDQVISGRPVDAAPGVINIEFLMGDKRLMPRFTKGAPEEPVLIFLRNKGSEAERRGDDPEGPLAGREYYVILGPQAYLRTDAGRIVPPTGIGDGWVLDLEGRTVSDVVEAVTKSTASDGIGS